jgi:hypothetical protein
MGHKGLMNKLGGCPVVVWLMVQETAPPMAFYHELEGWVLCGPGPFDYITGEQIPWRGKWATKDPSLKFMVKGHGRCCFLNHQPYNNDSLLDPKVPTQHVLTAALQRL